MAGLLSGVLPAIYSAGDWAKRQMSNIASDPVGVAQQSLGQTQDVMNEVQTLQQQAFGNPSNPLQITNRAALDKLVSLQLNSPLNPAMAGMVLGKVDPTLFSRASQMESTGASPGRILQETGLVRVPTSPTESTWGRQVSDVGATINPNILARVQTSLDKSSAASRQIPVENITLKDLLNHPELYKAYPEIGNISVEKINGFQSLGGVEGFYNSASNLLGVKRLNPYMTTPEEISKQLTERVSTLIHEAQHAVQTIEKWPRGGSSSEFALQSTKTAEDQVNWATKSLEDAVKSSFVSTGKAAPSNVLTLLDKVDSFKTKGIDSLKYLPPEQKEQVLFLANSPVADSFLKTYSRIEKVASKVDARKLAAHEKYLSIAGEEQARAVQKAFEQGTSKVPVTSYYDREPANLLYRDPFTPTIK